jgi:hypothetical protein
MFSFVVPICTFALLGVVSFLDIGPFFLIPFPFYIGVFLFCKFWQGFAIKKIVESKSNYY